MTDDRPSEVRLSDGLGPARYVLCPGMVTSKNDGRRHYIGAMALAQLYSVDIKQCEIFEPAAWWPPSFWVMAEERHRGLVKLTPRHDGNYTLPSGPNVDVTGAAPHEQETKR